MFAKLSLTPLPPGTAINSHRDNYCLPSFSLYLLLSLLQAEALPVSTGGGGEVELFVKQPGLLFLFFCLLVETIFLLMLEGWKTTTLFVCRTNWWEMEAIRG